MMSFVERLVSRISDRGKTAPETEKLVSVDASSPPPPRF